MALSRIKMTSDGQLVAAKDFAVSLTSGAEIKTTAEFDLTTASKTLSLSAPYVSKLPGSPPAMLGVLDGRQNVLVPAQYTWFDKPMLIDRSLVK